MKSLYKVIHTNSRGEELVIVVSYDTPIMIGDVCNPKRYSTTSSRHMTCAGGSRTRNSQDVWHEALGKCREFFLYALTLEKRTLQYAGGKDSTWLSAHKRIQDKRIDWNNA